MRFFRWLKHRITHKFEHFSTAKLKKFLKENGLAFVVIFVAWEIIEDVLFPLLFIFLGNYVHPAFYAGAPAAWLLCVHWLAVPLIWGWWLKIKDKKDKAGS